MMRFRVLLFACAAFVAAMNQARAVVGSSDASNGAGVVMVVNARGGVCSGVFVAPDVILTAAHCLANTQARVVGAGGARVVTVSAAHPEFAANAIKARRRSIDLALARVAGANESPARLSAAAPPRVGSMIDVSGYGLTNESNPRAIGSYARVELGVVAPHGVGKILVWAADPSAPSGRNGRGGCQGDSGGPMRDASGAVVAILTWSTGHGASRCGQYSQGILVAPQRAWIDRTLAGWGAQARWSE